MFQKIVRFFAEYFVFLGGFLFIFGVGVVYALVRPEGLVFNLVFLAVAIGWVIFLVKYFWELMEKHTASQEDNLQNPPKPPLN